jgi:DNA (cytosine-5)-methyltransferase 1
MRVLDLFSGIGGFSLGLERAGMQTVAFCEIEPYARRVLAKHWPDVPIHPDVTTREFIEGEADVITAGFPCQDLSLAGAGAGLAGERSGLYRHVVRAIRLVRPSYAILENVAALLGRGLGTVLGDLAEIGHDAEWHCIPASAAGAPHRRDRVWIVAYPDGRRPAQHAGSKRKIGLGAVVCGKAVADAHGFDGWPRAGREDGQEVGDHGGCHTDGPRLAIGQGVSGDHGEEQSPPVGADWWAVEPDVGRVAHGVPARVDRLKGLGNAVVPQIPEIIGRAILEAAP